MPALGSNINAALGRIDYSPIARGGESMARGIAQAGQVKGQTYASIGQNISQGIQKYQKNQLEKKEQEGARNMLEKALADPRLANALNLNPGDDNAYDKGELNAVIASAGGREKLSAFLNQGQQMAAQQDQLRSQNNLRAAQIKEIEMKETERQRLVAQQALTGDALQKAISLNRDTSGNVDYASIAPAMVQLGVPPEVANELVEGLERPPAGEIVSLAEYNRRLAGGAKLEGVPAGKGMVRITDLGSYSPASVTNINTTQDAATTAEINRITDQDARRANIWDNAAAAYPGIKDLNNALKMLEEVEVNTGTFQPFTQLFDEVRAHFGNEQAMREATAGQILNSVQGSQVFELFKELGLGARGLDTPAEREFMLDVLSGRVTMTKDAIRFLLTQLRDRKISRVESHNSRAKDSEGYGDYVKGRNEGKLPDFNLSFLNEEQANLVKDRPTIINPFEKTNASPPPGSTNLGNGFYQLPLN